MHWRSCNRFTGSVSPTNVAVLALGTLLTWMANEADTASTRPQLTVAVLATSYAVQDPRTLESILLAATKARIRLHFIAVSGESNDISEAALLSFMAIVGAHECASVSVIEAGISTIII